MNYYIWRQQTKIFPIAFHIIYSIAGFDKIKICHKNLLQAIEADNNETLN